MLLPEKVTCYSSMAEQLSKKISIHLTVGIESLEIGANGVVLSGGLRYPLTCVKQ